MDDMSILYYLTLAAGFLVSIWFFNFVLEFWSLEKKLSKLEGPKRIFLIGNIPVQFFFTNSLFPSNVFLALYIWGACKVFNKDGMVRIWLGSSPYVFLFHHKTVEPLLSSNIQLDKTYEYETMKPWLGTGLLTSTGELWRKRRKLLTPSFHFRILEEFQFTFSDQSQTLIQNLLKEVGKEFVDISKPVTMCTLDIICETALGVSVSAQLNSEHPYVKALHSLASIIVHRIMRPWLWVETTFALTSKGQEFYNSLKVIKAFTKEVIRKRRENPNSFLQLGDEASKEIGFNRKRLAFLDILLYEQMKDPTLLSHEDIQEEVDTFAFEGHDTTSVGITWCLYLLGLYPEIQEKVYQELFLIFGDSKDSQITNEHIKQMRYLECCIKESQRLYPSVPFVARKLNQDLHIGDHLLPKSTTCFVVMSILHRDPEGFPDPERFDPDRFLPENSNGRHPFAYVPFSAGPRNCIGQKFAFNEEKTVISNVIRNFKLNSLDQRDKILTSPDLVSRPVPNVRVKVLRRQ